MSGILCVCVAVVAVVALLTGQKDVAMVATAALAGLLMPSPIQT
jgi:hypothetical protein